MRRLVSLGQPPPPNPVLMSAWCSSLKGKKVQAVQERFTPIYSFMNSRRIRSRRSTAVKANILGQGGQERSGQAVQSWFRCCQKSWKVGTHIKERMDQIAETVLMGTLQVVLHIQCQNLHPTQNFGRYLLVVAEKSLKNNHC